MVLGLQRVTPESLLVQRSCHSLGLYRLWTFMYINIKVALETPKLYTGVAEEQLIQLYNSALDRGYLLASRFGHITPPLHSQKIVTGTH
jgi:hypothetical protein